MPPEQPAVQVQADGGWFCGSCRSLNTPGSSRCYSCRMASPFASAKGSASSSSRGLTGLVAIVLAGIVVIAGLVAGIAVVASLNSPKTSPSNSANLVAYASVDPSSTDSAIGQVPAQSPSKPVLDTAQPTIATTSAPTHTVVPSVTAKTTSTRAPSVAPTQMPVTAPPVTTVPLPFIPVSIPDVSISYYSITGATESDLISALYANGPAACSGTEGVACFIPTFRWTSTGSAKNGGVCAVTSLDFTATYSIILPKWTAPAQVSPALAAWWRKVLDHFVWHESQHLAIAQKYVPLLEAVILGGPCTQTGQANETASLSNQMQAEQDAFDAQDHSGWSWPAL
jgi:predicted secreted Zn-dependent protease